jgi:hypothetical protein
LPRGKLRWADIYKWAGVLHRDIGSMTLQEFKWAADGYAEANGAKPRGGTISDDRLSALGIVGF